jgi:hypothetical protein
VGDITKYVVGKATCRVIVTAAPAGEQERRAVRRTDKADASIV